MTQPVILYTFGGRKPNLELQLPYIHRILDEHPNTEWHLWDLARNPDDSHYMRSVKGDRIRVRTEFSDIESWLGISAVWKHYADQPELADHLFIKLDDDVVFLDTDSFGLFTAAARRNPERVVSALTVNNGACTSLIPAVQAIYGTLQIPLLDVHMSAEYAQRSHEWFLDNWAELVRSPATMVPTDEWLSINAVAMMWPTLKRVAELIGGRSPRRIAGRLFNPRTQKIGDEGAVNMLPRIIHTGFTAAHLTFGPQDDIMAPELLTDLRRRYADVGRRYLGRDGSGRVGVTISTHNRRHLLEDTAKHWLDHMPRGGLLVIVDDGSLTPVKLDNSDVRIVRHTHRMGVAMTKNRGLAELMDAGCEHLFLADDDVYPIVDDWWQPYVESPEPHLSYQWVNSRRKTWSEAHNDGTHWSITFPRGVLLYTQRHVVDKVGGFDIAHGTYGGEHVEWSQRIHDTGLTRWAYADVCGSDRLFFAHDKIANTFNSTFPLRQRRRMSKLNGMQWGRRNQFLPYRAGEGDQDYSLGPRVPSDDGCALLRHVVGLCPGGVAVEAGVGVGTTTRIIAQHMRCIGFDSFAGLPEKWRDGFDVGMFTCDPPSIPNVELVVGMFEDTMPGYRWPEYIGLLHLDADLYSSTRTVLEHVGPHLRAGSFVVFDEWHGFPGASEDTHEQKAWREYAARTGITWRVVGHGVEQWAVRIL